MIHLELKHDVSKVVEMRHSVRNYAFKQVDESTLNECMAPLTDETALFGAKTRYSAVYVEQIPVRLGTYGMIQGAKLFLVAVISKKDPRAGLLQVGYQLEQTVLLAADKGIGSCWIGGTFEKTSFRQAASVRPDEQLAVVVPVGYSAGAKHVFELIMRGIMGSARRKPFEKLFFHATDGKPLTADEADVFAKPLNSVHAAPSSTNRQPWRIAVSSDMVSFYLDHGKGQIAPSDIRYVDMGIAMCHFELAAQEAGLEGAWTFETPEFPAPPSYEFIATWQSAKDKKRSDETDAEKK